MFVKQTVNVIVSHTHYLEEACWVEFLTSVNASICAHLWRWLFQHHPQEIKWTFYRKWKLVSCPLISSKPFIQQERSWYWFVRVVCFKKKFECILSGNKKFCCKFCSSVFSIFLTVFIVFFCFRPNHYEEWSISSEQNKSYLRPFLFSLFKTSSFLGWSNFKALARFEISLHFLEVPVFLELLSPVPDKKRYEIQSWSISK